MTSSADENGAVGRQRHKPSKISQIDDNLKRVYKEMLDEDVPDRFEELLKQLREQDKS